MILTVKRLIILLLASLFINAGYAAEYKLEPVHTQILFFSCGKISKDDIHQH